MIRLMLINLLRHSATRPATGVRHSFHAAANDRSSTRHPIPQNAKLALLAIVLGLSVWHVADKSLAQSAPFALAQAGSGVLQLNDSGDAVADLQRQLTRLGFFSGEITGFFGTATQAAVSQFQQAQGLTPDGVVGAATQAALGQGSSTVGAAGSANAPRDLLQLNDSGEQVTELQRRLTALGYYSGAASGTFDGSTQFAVIQFQQANGLVADGIVGAETAAALRRIGGSAIPGSAPAGSPTPAAVPAAGGNLLRIGSSGVAVSTLQTQLQALGFYIGPITGTFDAATQAAVIAFQQSRGLTPDGIAGPQVNTALASTASNPAALPGTVPGTVPGASGTQAYNPAQVQYIQQMQQTQAAAEQARLEAEQARLEAEKARLMYQQNLQEGRYSTVELQRRLQSNGFNPGEINGLMTPNTETAVSEAQQKYGLSEGDFLGTDGASGTPLF